MDFGFKFDSGISITVIYLNYCTFCCLQDDDCDVRKCARRAITDLSSASDEEEVQYPHEPYAASIQSLDIHVISKSILVGQSDCTVNSNKNNATDLSISGLHASQEYLMERICIPLCESLYSSMCMSKSYACLDQWLISWNRCIGSNIRNALTSMLAIGASDSSTTSSAAFSKIFTAEILNNNYEMVSTIDMLVAVIIKNFQIIESDNFIVLNKICVWIKNNIINTLKSNVIQIIHALLVLTRTASEVTITNLLSKPELYGFIYGDLYLFRELHCTLTTYYKQQSSDRDENNVLTELLLEWNINEIQPHLFKHKEDDNIPKDIQIPLKMFPKLWHLLSFYTTCTNTN